MHSKDQVTQQNAAMAEENTAAITDLASQASSLQHALDQFKTGRAVAVPFARAPSGKRLHIVPAPRPAIRSVNNAAVAIAADWEEF
ncbi:hypothetical protein [Rhizobium herbae]